MRHGDELTQVAEWLYVTLSTSEDLAAALGTTLADLPNRVWPDVAPTGTASPWVVYSTIEGRDTLAVGNGPRLMSTVPVNVRAITKGADPSAGGPASQVFYRLLHGELNVPISGGGMILSSLRTQPLSYPENAGGIDYRHTGGLFNVIVN